MKNLTIIFIPVQSQCLEEFDFTSYTPKSTKITSALDFLHGYIQPQRLTSETITLGWT